MCITRPLHIVSHPPTQRTTCRWATPIVNTNQNDNVHIPYCPEQVPKLRVGGYTEKVL